MHFVKESQGIREKGFFGRSAGTTAIAAIVQQVDGTIGKCSRKAGHVQGYVLRVPPEIDKGASAFFRPGAHEHPRRCDWQRDHRRIAIAGARLWEVEKRALKEE